jgi:TetR/AcrR family transcriptional regulator, transcriptional repressor for nem operon
MPRRSVTDTAKTHQRILKHASHEFRSRGSAVGIADLMKDLGLTKGGFYRHFDSKDDLFVDAITLSFQETGERLEQIAEKAPDGQARTAIINAYLSQDHLDHPETWCTLPSLAPEIGRMPMAVRKRLDSTMLLYAERLSKYMKGETPQERRQNFMLLFSGMAGALALVRSFGEPELKQRALDLAREHYLKIFA